MALQTINIGVSANDGSGDPLRTAMDKINDNFLVVSRGVFNVLSYANGVAVNNGVADATAAIQAALTAIIAAGGGTLYLPAGDYSVDAQITLPDVPVSIKGEGMDVSRFIYLGGEPTDDAFIYRSSGAALIEGVEFSDFSVIGPWGGFPDHDDTDEMEDGGNHLFLLGKIDYLKIHRVGLDYSKNFSITLRRCHHYEIKDCRIRWSARDSISTGTCCHGKILDNTIEHGGDDGIACHDADGFLPVTQTTIISGNKIFDCYGINCLGAMKLQITNNSLDLCGAHGISVGYISDEGNVGALSVLIADNIINDVVNRNGIDGILNALAYIIVQPQTASAGNALTVAPGDNNTGDGTIQSPYPYFYSQGDDVNAERTGGYDIIIENNICIRTRNVGDLWSNFGFGETFSKNGWEDPTLTDAELIEGTGIVLGKSGGSHMRNLVVRGNTVRGVDTAVGMSGTYYENVDIKDNKFHDFKDGYGIAITATGSHTIEISENLFDGDPFLAAANRHASTKGAWQNETVPCAINNGSADGVSILRNRIRNCSTVTNGAGQKYERDNLIFCDFAVAGYNASNLGVGNLPSPGEQYWYVYQISDPTSASYGNVSNFCQKEAAAMPASGKYFLGMFIWARGIAPSTSGFMLGWKRLTTGTAHVLGTDWAEIAVPVVDYTNARVGIGVAPAVTAHWKKSDANTTSMMRVEQAGAGDASLSWVLTSVKNWVMGIDNSDSDKLKIGDGDNGFTDPVMVFVSSDNQVEVPGYLNVTGEAITGAGALTLGKTFHSLSNSSGSTYAVTLAAPTASQNGVVKVIEMIAGDGTNTVTLALTNVVGGSAATTATFDAAGETLVLVARSAKWVVFKELGVTLT